MSIAAVYGKQRRGKTLFATFYALHLAEEYEKCLVANFPFKLDNLARYCRLMNYKWLGNNIEKGGIRFIKCNDTPDLVKLFKIPNSIILADEMAVYLPSRGSSWNTPVELREALVQVGHEFQHLIYIAQNQEQVDTALRSQCEEIFHANGKLKYSKQLKNDALIWKSIHRFETDGYQIYNNDAKIRRNPIKVRILANKSWTGIPSCADTFIFNIYDSFTKLSNQSSKNDHNSLKYLKIKDWAWVSNGNNPWKTHQFSDIIAKLFKLLPGFMIEKIIALDKNLSEFKGFTALELKIIKWGGWTIGIMIILGLIT